MTTANLTDADLRVRNAVRKQLDSDPEVDAGAIGVAAQAGAVTLTGYVESYAGKLAAERAAKRVRGVRAVANDIEVRLRLDRTDADIARDAVHALRLHSSIPEGIQATVHAGHVSLTGAATWLFQKQEAEIALRHIRGVRSIANYITVTAQARVRDVRRRIVRALHRNADVDANQITVTVTGDTATLTGTVGSWLQRESAERAAANAPGIARIDSRLVIKSEFPSTLDETDDAG